MKIVLVTAFLLTIALCFQVLTPQPGVLPIAAADTTIRNPNGSSELSDLMRDMQAYTARSREHVLAGKAPEPYPASFDKIYTAKISEGMSKSDFYNQFSDLYVASVKNYAESTPEKRLATHNNMVSACLACHSQHCPGPVKAIRKLMINVE